MRSSWPAWLTGVALAALGAGPAVAAPPSEREALRLEFSDQDAARGCLDEERLTRAVSAILGRSPWSATARGRVVVVVRGSGDRLTASIRLESGQGRVVGRRRIETARRECGELGRAVALAISIAIDPAVALRPLPGPVPGPVPAVRPRRTTPAAPLQLTVSLAGHVALGSAPGPNPGATLQLGARRRWLELAVEARVDGFGHKSLATGRVDGLVAAGSLLACLRWHVVAGCGVFTAGALAGGGVDLGGSQRILSAYLAPGLRFFAELPFAGGFFVRGLAQLDVPLRRARFLDSARGTELWSAPPVAGLWGVGLGVRLR